MANHFKVRDHQDVVEAVRWALAAETCLEIRGLGTKRNLGRPPTAENILDLSDLRGISLYEPDELVLSAAVGTPMAEIESQLRAEGQELAFEPPNYAALLDPNCEKDGGEEGSVEEGGGGSIGGIVATNLAGPRRLLAGAARDHLLGFSAVNGRAEIFKSGGRVVKNVTGYDLSKLLAGSHGTLAAMTSVTVKVLPAGQKSRTVLIFGLSPQQAAAAHALAGRGPYYLSAMAHLPAPAAARSAVDYVNSAARPVTALRLEGTGTSVAHRATALRQALAEFGDTEELHTQRSRTFWRQVRDVADLLPADTQIWKISLKPSDGPAVVQEILAQTPGEALFDWACGLVWLSLEAAPDGHHDLIRQHIAGKDSGHATLIRAGEAVRASIPVFQPQPPALAALSARLKHSFDPQSVFNPGRMYKGL